MAGSRTSIILDSIFFSCSFTDIYVILPIPSKEPDIKVPLALFFLNFKFYVKLRKCISAMITD